MDIDFTKRYTTVRLKMQSVFFLFLGIVFGGMMGYGSGINEPQPHIVMGPVQFENKLTDELIDREPVVCEFDEPIGVVVSIMHYYDSYDELNHDYQVWGMGSDEVWGWSTCEWQPLKNISMCDVYTVHPKYIHADMAMDTIGHEVYHGSCGDFHE